MRGRRGGACQGLAMASSTDRPDADPLEFACPRCHAPVAETFYGPCAACREALVASSGGEARDIEVAAYEPKRNVTPNAVASKE